MTTPATRASLAVAVTMLWPRLLEAKTAAWQRLNLGLNEVEIIAVAALPWSTQRLYAASRQAVYRSADGGASWRECFRAPSQATIAFLAVDPFDAEHVMAATDQGVYASANGGGRWRRVFRGTGEDQQRCQTVLFHPLRRGEVLLGTGNGLWVSRDGGQRWQAVADGMEDRSVAHLALALGQPARAYAVTDDGLYAGDTDEAGWRRLFALPGAVEPEDETEEASEETEEDEEEDEEEEAEEEGETSRVRRLTAIAVDPLEPTRLFLASTDGLHLSDDGGVSWRRAGLAGLGTPTIRFIALSSDRPPQVYAATDAGVALYRPDTERWERLYAGLPTEEAWFVAITDSRVIAATDAGVFARDHVASELPPQQAHTLEAEQVQPAATPPVPLPPLNALLAHFVHEPTVRQVQEIAIEYAEVHPDKIKRWRQQAYAKALLPTVDFTLDRNKAIDETINSYSGTYPNYQIIPSRDLDRNWDLTVGWDLADLIWSTDQSTIELRSNSLVELRDDLMDEVTRAYFERRRLQIELLANPPADATQRLDHELRIRELSATLDGLTGGWFSEQLE